MNWLGVISVPAFLTVCVSAFADAPAEDHIQKMTDEAASWADRCAAEDALAKIPPKQVLPKLLPHIVKGMPSGPIWNSGGREHDKRGPVKWQVFYAVSRSWNHQVASLPRDTGGTLLLELLKKTSSPNAQSRLITDLMRRWVADAESTVAALLKDPQKAINSRVTAGFALILHGKGDYHELLLEYANESNHVDRKRWYDLLSDPSNKKKTGVDVRVVIMGFNLIRAEQNSSPEYIHGAYFLAVTVGDYVGQEFKPDKRLPRYRGKHGLTDEFFGDTVKNALHWWNDNKEKMEKGLRQSAAADVDKPRP